MSADTPKTVRRTLGDGRWFPADERHLREAVEGYMAAATQSKVPGRIVASIAPHAGYPYSGPVAGHTFRALREDAAKGAGPETVVVVGFCHRVSFKGVALMDGDALRSPLGETPLDAEAAALIADGRDRIRSDYGPHRGEWSAENEIPFVQAALPNAKLVVALIGDHDPATADQLVEGLTALADKRRIVVVASTDLLHDPDYDLVSRTDKETLKKIVAMNDKALLDEWSSDRQLCCGLMPVVTAIRFARKQGSKQGLLLKYRNSGDDHPESRGDYVVGYGAVVFPVPTK